MTPRPCVRIGEQTKPAPLDMLTNRCRPLIVVSHGLVVLPSPQVSRKMSSSVLAESNLSDLMESRRSAILYMSFSCPSRRPQKFDAELLNRELFLLCSLSLFGSVRFAGRRAPCCSCAVRPCTTTHTIASHARAHTNSAPFCICVLCSAELQRTNQLSNYRTIEQHEARQRIRRGQKQKIRHLCPIFDRINEII